MPRTATKRESPKVDTLPDVKSELIPSSLGLKQIGYGVLITDPLTGIPALSFPGEARRLTSEEVQDLLSNFP
jgi:hypothetical protein